MNALNRFPVALKALCGVKRSSRVAASLLVVLTTTLASHLLAAPNAARDALNRGGILQPQASIAVQGLRFESLSIADGLSQSVVTAILQDRQGYMWFATRGGLNRYDGYQFTVYKHDADDDATLSDNQVNVIYEDRSGELWVGTNRGLDRFDRTTERFIHYRHSPGDPQSLSAGAVLSICEDGAGALWVGTTGGLNRFAAAQSRAQGDDPAVGRFKRYQHQSGDPRSLSNNAVWAIYKDLQDELWFGTNGGLDRFDGTSETFVHYQHDLENPHSLSDNRVRAIFEDRRGGLWVGTEGGGLNRLHRSTGAFVHYRHDPRTTLSAVDAGQVPDETPDRRYGLSDNRVTAIVEDGEGRLWVGTQGGLDLLDASVATGQAEGQSAFLHYANDPQDPTSLADDLVLSLYVDRSGVLWVGTHGGLSKHDRTANRFQVYQQGSGFPNALSDNLVQAIYEDRGGRLWIGTFAGGLNRLDRDLERVTVYRYDPEDAASLSSNDVRSIHEDRDGVVWVGTDLGLDRFDPQRESFKHTPGLDGVRVTVMREDRAGDLWIGTSAGLYRLDRATGDLRAYDAHGLSGNYVSAIYEDRVGVLWVGTYGGGINRWDTAQNRFTPHVHDPQDPQSLSSDVVLAVFGGATLDDGVIWVGTEEGGLNRFDPLTETFSHYTAQSGLPGDTVGCILADAGDHLWLGTNRGLSRFDPGTETFRNYQVRDGLQRGEFVPGACFQGTRGEMFFGGFQGLNAFFPEKIQPNLQPPPVVVTAFEKFNQTVRTNLSADEHIRLSHRDNFVSFEFAALDYVAPEKNRYAFKMEGLDQDWVYAGTHRRADYPDLKPGEYVLRVKGSNNDGVWNEDGVAIRITVTPPVWQTWWFRGVVLLALLAVVVGGYRLRISSVEARSRELERQVEERTHEIQQRRQVAEGLRDIVAVLNSHRPLDDILDYIVNQAGRLLGSGAAVLHQIDPERGFVAIDASCGLPDELMAIEGLSLHATSVDAMMLDRVPYVGRDIQDLRVGGTKDSPRDPHVEQWLSDVRRRFRSLLAVPLIVEEGVYGYIAFYYTEPQTFSQDELALAVAFADQAALAIENARLRNRAEAAAVAAERNRLARDMHDSVTQSLFSLTLLAEAGQRMIKARDLEQSEDNQALLSQIARQALQEMRLMVYELRPPAVEGHGLAAAVEHRLEAVERRAGVDARLVLDAVRDLPPEVQEELYRIAHESLNNALKHANASAVTVALRDEDKDVVLEVVDDGQGFDPDGVRGRGGMGLVSMQERAERIGGSLTIHSAPGQGTRVRVVVGGY